MFVNICPEKNLNFTFTALWRTTFMPSSSTSSRDCYAEFLRFRPESPRPDYYYDFTSSLELTVKPYTYCILAEYICTFTQC